MFLLYFLAGCSGNQVTELGQSFIESVYESIGENRAVNFSEITDFDWEQLVIISPYSTVNNVLVETGLNWRNPVTHIQHSDVNTLLLFAYENNVVAFVHFPRGRVDFVQVVRDGNVFDKSDATFIFDNDI